MPESPSRVAASLMTPRSLLFSRASLAYSTASLCAASRCGLAWTLGCCWPATRRDTPVTSTESPRRDSARTQSNTCSRDMLCYYWCRLQWQRDRVHGVPGQRARVHDGQPVLEHDEGGQLLHPQLRHLRHAPHPHRHHAQPAQLVQLQPGQLRGVLQLLEHRRHRPLLGEDAGQGPGRQLVRGQPGHTRSGEVTLEVTL